MQDHDNRRVPRDATERLAQAMEKHVSFSRRFLLGMVSGVGTAIGATIIASVIIFILVQFLQSVGWQDMIDSWKDEMQTELIEEATKGLRP